MKTLFSLLLCLFLLTSCTNKNERKYTIDNTVTIENSINTKQLKVDDVTMSFTYEVKEQNDLFEHIYKIKINEEYVENGKDLIIKISPNSSVVGKFKGVQVDGQTYCVGKYIVKYDGYSKEMDKCEACHNYYPAFLFNVPNKSKNLEVYAEFTMFFDKFYVGRYHSATYTHNL